MPIVKKICRSDVWELRDHKENTCREFIKWYTLAQLSLIDGIDTRTVRKSWKYLPIRIDDSRSMCLYRQWKMKKPYKILWIRVDEIKYIFKKRNKWKCLVTDYIDK